MFFGKKPNKELDQFAELLVKGVVGLFAERGEVNFSKKPVPERKNIYEYEGRMRIDGMEKFNNEPTYISAINYYKDAAAMENHDALGVLIVYVKQEYMLKLMRKLEYPPIDDDNDDELRDSCGTLCNIIAGRFKSEISKAGYIELEMSHFYNFRNSSFGGVEFCPSEFDKIELELEIESLKQVVVEMSIGAVPRLAQA